MNITALGIDIAKNVFQLYGIDANGKVILEKKVGRDKLVQFIARLSVCKIGQVYRYLVKIFELLSKNPLANATTI